jgi:hypothetical protein
MILYQLTVWCWLLSPQPAHVGEPQAQMDCWHAGAHWQEELQAWAHRSGLPKIENAYHCAPVRS